MNRSRIPNVLLVNPRFSPHAFWNYKETCAVVGARHVAAPLGLITVAALLPEEWNLRLVDRNAAELRKDDLQWADLVMIGGMLPQQRDAKRIIVRAHSYGKPVVVGGPDVTASPAVYADADFRVLGEAEELMDDFVGAWRAGSERGTFVARSFPDLTQSPLPRFDLLKLEDYLHVGVQFSRGCPYNCEFCNVIELNGRVPRFKRTSQMLRELDSLHQLGYRGHVDFVDDNLIGNRKVLRSFLAALEEWREAHGCPFEFSTEVSLNLADHDDLLAAMRRAGFFAVFVGIESPDTEILLSTQKAHNARRNIGESLRKIYRAGMFVNAGFIVGFDAERASVARAMVDCIEEAAIPVCMVGLLYALPNTQLARRLLSEGRLHADSDRVTTDCVADQCTSGLNYTTLRPRQEILADYRIILREIYHPRAFFGRVRRMALTLDLSRHGVRSPLRALGRHLRSFLQISLQTGFRDRKARPHYWRALGDCLLHNPRAIRTVVSLAALYLHIQPFAQFMDQLLSAQIESIRTADSHVPLMRVAAVEPAPPMSAVASGAFERD
ncbi:MAG: B12-binding domain-containing radical SAM protein [Candidatus Eisenbacteria sp.]|nr:B12-binding domain-containing radical SAM protein [Candidatus Eisenbacteria bacterium]